MSAVLAMVARALVEHCDGRTQHEISSACDDALQFLHQHGASHAAVRALPATVRRQFRDSRRTFASIATASGSIGSALHPILSAMERTLGVAVELEESADASLIGGAVLTIGDDRFDGSVRGALAGLQHHLTRS